MGVQVSSLAPPVNSEGYPFSGDPFVLSKEALATSRATSYDSAHVELDPYRLTLLLLGHFCIYRVCQLSKLKVAGSNPVSRSKKLKDLAIAG
jgi:hypothetical protein